MDRQLENLTDFISEKSKNNKTPDKLFMTELTQKIIAYCEVSDYVQKIVFKNKYIINSNVYEADYRQDIKAIEIYLRGIKTNFLELCPLFYQFEDEKNIAIGKYLYCAFNIFHECIHALQYKNYDNGKNDWETKIITPFLTDLNQETSKKHLFLFREQMKHLQKAYELYDYSPLERYANAHALYKIVAMCEALQTEPTYKMFMYLLYSNYLNPYEELNEPTIYFLEQLGYHQVVLELKSHESEFDFDDRVNLGLYLSKKEKNQLEETKMLFHS